MIQTLYVILRDDRGGSIAEYGIIAAGIALPLIGLDVLVSSYCGGALTTTGNALTTIGQTAP